MVHVARLNLGPPLPDRKGNGKPHQTAHVLSFLPLEGTVNSEALLPLAERDASSAAAADRDELHRGGGGLGYRVTASLAPHVLVEHIVHVECTGPVPADLQLHPGRRASDAGQGPSEL